MFIPVPNAGRAGVIKDLSKHELPLGAWTDALNVRFLDGYAQPFLGHGAAYSTPQVTPYHVVAVNVGDQRYWLYVGQNKVFAVTIKAGIVVHTNLTRSQSVPSFKLVPLPMYGQTGMQNGLLTNIGTFASVRPFSDEYSGLRNGLLNNARSTHATAPNMSLSAFQNGLVPANVPAGVNATLVAGTTTSDVNYRTIPNQITSTLLSGIPIINPGNLTDPPQQWNLDIGARMKVLDNWPANTYCKSLRAYKNYLVALNVTKAGQNYPFMVKWSSPADPGAVPATWDTADQTQDAGEVDLAQSPGRIIDGLPLRDMFMIYKEDSIVRMTPSGTNSIFNFQPVLGTSGALNRNCIVELDGVHFVLTGSDVIVHDGQSASSVLDKQARRALFGDFDVSAIDRAFVVKNPFLNEVMVCYASVGNSIPNKAMVWNYVDKTISYRQLPAVHHANFGAIDASLGDIWSSDGDPWNSDITLWNGPDFTPNTTRVLMASDDPALYLLDTSATFNGVKPSWFVERVGLSLGTDQKRKLIQGIRPRITGNVGETVIVEVGGSEDPYLAPVYDQAMTFTIGETISCDCFVDSRYPAIRFSNGTAYFSRLDSYDIEVVEAGEW